MATRRAFTATVAGFACGGLALLTLIVFTVPAAMPRRAFADASPEREWVASAVSVQGKVMVRRNDTRDWRPVRLGDRFLAGDMIKVEANSRAAFVLNNESTLRVDQHSTLVFRAAKPQQPFLMELIHGAIHFFSRVNRNLRLITPFVNGAVEGTEFVARVDDQRTTVSLFEGRLKLFNEQGSVQLAKNQTVVARSDQPPRPTVAVRPRDAVQWTLYYPTVVDFRPDAFGCDEDWCLAAQQSIAAWRQGHLLDAFAAMVAVPEGIDDPLLRLYRATLQLTVGRVHEAMSQLEQIEAADAKRSDALALKAIVALVQNDKQAAQRWVDQARSRPRMGTSVGLALSYVQQAFFNLAAATDTVVAATEKDPDNALAWARLSELYLSQGNRAQAQAAARRAAALQPELARTQNVLGFARLAQIKTQAARQAFEKAIALDSADPLARLGLGLAKIRDGQLAEGRAEIEIAACLDPGNALIRSYLGKAYFEEKRDDSASAQLEAAKQLDPADPTPWFYDAIRKQSLNRPVEALHDLQQSMALNDNRAVYRSRLLLDSDLAARSAGIGRIYRALGFEQLALVEGWKSVNTDPGNYSAHRFLADAYSVLPRHEIARVSELLQSQLLQPININPIQPSLAETRQFILAGTEPSAPAFNEFGPLFQRNRMALQASGVIGNNSTWGDEITLSGLYDRYSVSLGQRHHETEGFRDNNDLTSNLYNAFAQVSLTPKASLMAEYRRSDTEKGDLPLRFTGEFFNRDRQETDRQSIRFGGRYSPNVHNGFLGTVVLSQMDGYDQLPDLDYAVKEDQKAYMAEVQHLLRSGRFNLVSGIGHFHADSEYRETDWGQSSVSDRRVDHTTPYSYATFTVGDHLTGTLGASIDFYNGHQAEREQFNPKIGASWEVTRATAIRAAVFRTLKRDLIADQTLEPTQVAGFNQFFDDANRTQAWRYGVALDQAIGERWFAGAEYSFRDMTVSWEDFDGQLQDSGWDEQAGRAYLFWTPHDWISASLEYGYSRFERDGWFVGEDYFTVLTTHKIPVGVNVFHPSGWFLRAKATYVDQDGAFGWPRFFPTESGSDHFWVVDATMGYRLPKRCGIISLDAKNLFDRTFQFQDTDPSNPEIIPERSVLAKITLSF